MPLYKKIGDEFLPPVITKEMFNSMVHNIDNKIKKNTTLSIPENTILNEIHDFIDHYTFNPKRIFNYYEKKWSYFYDQDIQYIEGSVYDILTHDYHFRRLQYANKIASNPWNNEYNKKTNYNNKTHVVNNTNKLTAPRTYNKIEPCFI